MTDELALAIMRRTFVSMFVYLVHGKDVRHIDIEGVKREIGKSA